MEGPTGQNLGSSMKSDTAQDIESQLQKMGYILATPANPPIPSYYGLEDGTILSVLARINYVLVNTSESGTGAVNHTMDVGAFVPPDKRLHVPTPNKSPTIVNQDIKCIRLREEFNDYKVGDDIVVSAKAVVAQVDATDMCSNKGEPIYNVNAHPIIKVVDKRHHPFAQDMR